MRNLVVFECPSNLGLKRMSYAKEPGVKKFPVLLNQLGFYSAIGSTKTIHIKAPKHSMEIDPITNIRNARSIINYSLLQADVIGKQISEDTFLLILGGDCSILIGSAIAFKKKGRFGLFFLDGHTDYMIPECSHTHGAAGMDLAIVCGYGHDNLTNIDNLCPYFEAQNVFCVGNREYDEEYEKPIRGSEIHYFPLNELRKIGIRNVINQFFAILSKNQLDGFFIHLDVDVLDDTIMPAVDSRQSGGLSYPELKEILTLLFNHDKISGMEITIFDPDLDPDKEYINAFMMNMIPIINKIKTT